MRPYCHLENTLSSTGVIKHTDKHWNNINNNNFKKVQWVRNRKEAEFHLESERFFF